MKNENLTPKADTCPYCYENHNIHEGTKDCTITIICQKCNKHFLINLLTRVVTKKHHISDGDNDALLTHKCRCPFGCRYAIFNKTPVDTIISVMCPKCNRFFRANLLNRRTWKTKAQSGA